MNLLILKSVLGAFLVVLTSIAGAQDIFERNAPVPFAFLQKMEPGQTVGKYPVLTVGNEWGLFHAKVGNNNLGQAIGYVSAIDIRDGKLFAILDMSGNLEENNSGDWTDEPCKRNDFLYKKGEGFRNINCVSINYSTGFFQNPKGDFQVYYGQFRDMKLEIVPTVIRIDFTRYSDRGRRLSYSIKLNPEVFGFERDAERVWGANSWNRAFLEKDPKKVAFIAGLSKWADAVRDRMDKAFDHQKDAFDGLPTLESFLKPASS